MTDKAAATTRRQLSLFLSAEDAMPIERLRTVLDPLQYHLIPAHITLCREDELEALEPVIARLQVSPYRSVRLTFGRPFGFAGHGILMPCIDGLAEFQRFREYLLGSCQIKTPQPHLTLAHPRVCLIEQVAMTPWRVLADYAL